MTLLLLAAALAVPMDGDGAYAHAFTLPIANLTSPGPLQRPSRFVAWGRDGDDLWLSAQSPYGSSWLKIDETGALERLPDLIFPAQVNGNVVIGDGHVTFCQMPAQMFQLDLATGATTPVGPAMNQNLVCEAWQRGDDWTLTTMGSPNTAYTIRRGATVAETPIDHSNWAFEDGAFQTGVRPCSGDATSPFGTWWDHDGAVHLARLDDQMRPGEMLWSYTLPTERAGWTDLGMMRSCEKNGERLVLAEDGEVWVFEGTELVSVIRNGTDPAEITYAKEGTNGPYSLGQVVRARLVGDLLVVAEREPALLKLYRKDGAANGPLGDAVTAAAGSPARIEAMLALGWWEAAEDEARSGGHADLLARARGIQITHWARRGQPSEVWSPGNVMKQYDSTYLEEIDTLLKASPKVAEARLARALLLQRLDRRDESMQALSDLVPLLGGTLTAADVPELFELAEQRGDAEAMRAGIDALPQGRERTLRTVRTLRVEGEPDDAMDTLSTLDPEDPVVALWQGRLESDRGKLDQAIAHYTRANRLTNEEDPTILGELAVAYLRRGLAELAVDSLLKAVDRAPTEAVWRSNLAAAYAAMDKQSDALGAVYQALGSAPNDPVLQHQLERLNAKGEPKPGGTLAVLPFDVRGSLSPRVGLGDFVATLCTTTLVEQGQDVVERMQIDAVLAEQDLQSSQYVDPSRAVELGKVVGAESLITGNAAEFDGKVVLDLRRVDVASGKVKKTAHVEAPLEVEAIRAALETALQRL